MAKTFGIVSLKGGVGKTSSVIALGDALSDFGQRVLLVDANFSAPNLGIHLNLINPAKTLHDVLARAVNIRDAIYSVGGKFHILPASLFPKEEINPLALKDKLKDVKRDYDTILIDSSPSLNDETLSTILASDELLAVTTPDYSTLGTTIKAIKLARNRGTPLNGLILNKVYNKNFELPIKDIEKVSGVPVLAVIPHDINFLKSQARFIPPTVQNPGSGASQEFRKLAATLIGKKYQPNNFLSFFREAVPSRSDVNREVYYHRVFK